MRARPVDIEAAVAALVSAKARAVAGAPSQGGKLVPVKTGIGKAVKMLKKVTTNIKAAVVLIVTENVASLRMFVKNVTNSVFKSTAKHQNAMWRNKKRP